LSSVCVCVLCEYTYTFMVLCVLYWQSGPFAPSATAVAFVNGGKKGI